MKRICIQIQPERNTGLDVATVVDRLRNLVGMEDSSLSEGDDNGKYVNLTCRTHDVRAVWSQINGELQESGSPLAVCSIVTCEGDAGWDDYLLLHHFDEDVKVDKI